MWTLLKTNKMRYALGSDNGKILYVIGVNPSVASASKLDPTVTNVKKFAELLGYDSFIMLNLYPQRATNPDNIHKRINRAEHLKNLGLDPKFCEMLRAQLMKSKVTQKKRRIVI